MREFKAFNPVAEPLPTEYGWGEAVPHTEAYLIRWLLRLLLEGSSHGSRVLDLGCGNGALADRLTHLGYEVVGVDPSASGIAAAQRRFPTLQITRRQPQRKILAR